MNRLKEWFTFRGRISRKTFIIRVVIIYLISNFIIPNIPALFIDIPESLKNINLDDMQNGKISFDVFENLPTEIYVVGAIVICLSIIFSILFYAAVNRRFHDAGHKSIWTLVLFILRWLVPNIIAYIAINAIFVIYLAFKDGTIGENKYGPDPLNTIDYGVVAKK